ncbi:hypothetical protein RvY_16198 [Ramazzottius varieornatus]|uniref:Uncharacterized protein n=1 Tax=Ramazzottius varieornatus TaxID=947166 RepID=A0A1D1VYJ9_RAMVA|nr:hypothetical protein RvY_16198 [Ramazzottius varieornatus]
MDKGVACLPRPLAAAIFRLSAIENIPFSVIKYTCNRFELLCILDGRRAISAAFRMSFVVPHSRFLFNDSKPKTRGVELD